MRGGAEISSAGIAHSMLNGVNEVITYLVDRHQSSDFACVLRCSRNIAGLVCTVHGTENLGDDIGEPTQNTLTTSDTVWQIVFIETRKHRKIIWGISDYASGVGGGIHGVFHPDDIRVCSSNRADQLWR